MSSNEEYSIKEFATLVVNALRKLGDTTRWRFNPQSSFLFPRPEDGDEQGPDWRVNLSNFHREWLMLAGVEKTAHIEKIAASIHSKKSKPINKIPSVEIQSKLFVAVRSTADRDAAITMYGADTAQLLFREIVDGLEACVMVDGEQDMRRLMSGDLDAYGMSETEAFEIGIANLRQRSSKPMVNVGNGLYLSSWNDDYDSSRLLLPELLQQYIKEGQVVAFAPSRTRLLITSDQSESGMAAMMQVVESQLGQPRSLPPRMLRLSNGHWSDFQPEKYAIKLNHWRTNFEAEEYGQQKTMIEERMKSRQADIFVASFMLGQVPMDRHPVSACTWSKGVTSLLPRTHLICFMDPAKPDGAVVTTRADALPIVGAMMKSTENILLRFYVDEFPNSEQLAQLKLHAYRR
nr:hypothetical protein [Rhodoferax sp.]